MAEETRRKVYDMLVAEKMLVQGFHYPFPALAYIEKSRQRVIARFRCRGARRSSSERFATTEKAAATAAFFLSDCSNRIALDFGQFAALHCSIDSGNSKRERRHDTSSIARTLLAGTAAAAAASSPVRNVAGARRRAARRQAGATAGIAMKVGTIEVTVISDGARIAAAGQLRAQQEPATRSSPRSRPRYLSDGPLHAAVQFGGGEHRLEARRASTPASARRARAPATARWGRGRPISPPPASTSRTIDAVVISHFHGDHINGARHRRQAVLSERRGHGARRRNGISGWTTAT